MRRPNLTLGSGSDSVPEFWLGVNYWSRGGGPDMWIEFDPGLVEQELRQLREHGIAMTRSFLNWPQFMPEPGVFDGSLFDRYGEFLDLCEKTGTKTIPTFIVGHMSGEDRDPAWREGRDLYSDPFMIEQQSLFVSESVRRFAEHPAVCGWLLSNEMPLYAGPGEHGAVTTWVKTLVQAIRDAGGTQPVSAGDGAWGIETSGKDNGFRIRELEGVVDWVGPHVYPHERDEWRQLLQAAFVCELDHFGRPVIMEEFGASSAFGTDESIADYYRHVLATTLLAGATGWVAWNNTDFDRFDRDPYRHHGFELRFGLIDATGKPKPQLAEMTAFGELLEKIDAPRCRRPDTKTAIVVSSYLEVAYPFIDPGSRPLIASCLLQSYVSAHAADLGAGFLRERDGLEPTGGGADDAALLIVPSTQALTGPGWRGLEERARAGATMYVSYFNGEATPNAPLHPGMWHPDLNAFFGVRHLLRHDLRTPLDETEVSLRLEREFGGLGPGTELRFRVAGTDEGRAFLPLEPAEAEVLAVDAHGRPALLRRRLGSGSIVLCIYPLEYFASCSTGVNPDDAVRLYQALAREAGAAAPVRVTRPDVHVDRLAHEDGRAFSLFVSYSGEPLSVEPELEPGLTLHNPASGAQLRQVELAPRGLYVAELRGA